MSAHDFSLPEMRRRMMAADLLVRLQEGRMSASDRVACQQWRAEPGNEQAFQEAEAMFRVLSKLSRRERSAPARRPPKLGWTLAKVAACFAGLSFIGTWLALPRLADHGEQYVTALDEWSNETLADGSEVLLGPCTELEFRSNEAQRIVDFERGEALFNVTEDAQRPFVVRDGSIAVEAVGTSFAVSKLSGPPEVTVKEGTVRVSPNKARDAAIYVSAGQQLTVVPGGPLTVNQVDLESKLAWANRSLNLDGLTIGQAVAQFNQRNTLQIEIDDATVPRGTVLDGWANLNDPESFAQSLAKRHNAVIDRRQPNVLRLMAVHSAMK